MSITGGGFFQSGNGPMTISCCSRGPALATASRSFPFFGNGFTNNGLFSSSRDSKIDLFKGNLGDVETLDKFGGDTTMGGGGTYLLAMFGDPDIIDIGVSGENGVNESSAFFFSNLVCGVDGLSNISGKDEMTNDGISRKEQ